MSEAHIKIFGFLFPFIVILSTLGTLIVGLYVIIKKKPIIFTSQINAIPLFVIYIPLIIFFIDTFYNFNKFLSFLLPLSFLISLTMIIWNLKGKIIIGINTDDFHKVLIDTLNSLNYIYEETISKIKIIDPELDIYLILQPGMGTGQIRLLKGDKIAFNKIITILKENIKSKQVRVDLKLPIIFIISDVILITISIILFKIMSNLMIY